MNLLIFPLTGTPNALFSATYKILASRGGRNPTSTGSGFGGSIKRRGLAPAPFLFFRSGFLAPISLAHINQSEVSVIVITADI